MSKYNVICLTLTISFLVFQHVYNARILHLQQVRSIKVSFDTAPSHIKSLQLNNVVDLTEEINTQLSSLPVLLVASINLLPLQWTTQSSLCKCTILKSYCFTPLYRLTCISRHLQLRTEGSCLFGARADSNQHIWIREKTLEFSSTVLPILFLYQIFKEQI